jgi:class 3 adenylate cyclase/tetratricopeptide (TPR) repeat protein
MRALAPGADPSGAGTADAAGERKHVTVLFADVTASMAVLTSHDAEEAAALFDRVIELMTDAVRQYEGTVTQILGDGVLALFGAPIAHEDHAVRACYAALSMQERISAYGDSVQRTHGIPIQIRVGLNSGEVVLRTVGPDPGVLSAVGQTVHLASRMEQLAKPGTILATGVAASLARGRVRSRALGPVNVKGLVESVEVVEITGAVAPATRVETSPRSLSPLVGRAVELDQLSRELETVRQGPGRLVAVTGEPGIGKTRIVQEFLAICRARGAVTFGTTAQTYTRVTGQRTGLDIIRSYFDIDRADAPDATRAKVGTAMRALDPSLATHVPAVLWQLGCLEDGDPFWRLDAATRRLRGFEANFQLIGAEARRQPFVLVVENLQWVDSSAEESLRLFAKGLTPFTLVLVTYRPEYEDTWLQVAGAVRLHLGPLRPAVAADLLDGLLGPAPALDPVKHVLVERTGGNPFFLEESVRDLVQGGVLSGERGRYRPDHTVTSIHVPPTIRSVLEARIDRLSAEDKRVLHCAAVIGEEVPSRLLEAVADLPAEDARAALRRLRDAEFLEEQALFPEPVYAFRHSLTHDVAYGDLLHERRRVLHGRALAALERAQGEASEAAVEALAHHAAEAELWEQALAYARLAALKTGPARGNRETVAFLEQALAALGHLPDDPPHRALAVDLRADLSRALAPVGEHPRMVAMLREAEAIAAGLGDQARLARTQALLASAYWEVGDSVSAVSSGERAVELAERVGDPALRVVANFSLGGAARAIGEYRRAVALLRGNLELTDGAHAAEHFGLAGVASVLTRGHLAWSLAELGEFPEAVQRADEAIRLAQRVPHAFSQAHAQLALGGTLLRQGRLGEAIAVLERGLVLAREAPFLYAPIAGDLGVIYTRSGRAAAGVELVERAVAEARRMGRLGRLSLIVTHQGEAYLFAGRREDAEREGERALQLALERGERGNQVYAHRLLGNVAAESDPPRVDVARRHYGAGLELAEALGMRPLLARCHLGLGRLERHLGHDEAASHHLGAATELFEALEMKYWLDRLALDRVGPA